jgi:hypothetical protein
VLSSPQDNPVAAGPLVGVQVDWVRLWKGVSFERTATGFVLAVATRSWWGMCLAPLAALWTVAWAALFYGFQVMTGRFSPLLCLFGLPFVLLGPIACFQLLRWSFGSTSISVDGHEGTVREGIGLLSRTRRFCWAKVSEVYKTRTWYSKGGTPNSMVVLVEGARLIDCGSWPLGEAQRAFLVVVLRTMLAGRGRGEPPRR